MKSRMKYPSNRILRHRRIRKVLAGTPARPRLCLFRSLRHLEAQIIDDLKQQTLVSASTREEGFRGKGKAKAAAGGNVETAKTLGAVLAKKAKDAGVTRVVFDRAGYLYHGRVKAFADAARENGLQF
jgi:large subunit ribosomal protein L18